LVDWIDGADHNPLVVLFHGLEGSSKSHYAIMLAHQLKRLNWRGAIVHFRSCGGVDNLLPRAYHAGDSREIEWILQHFQSYQKLGPLFACGVSLGGNVLLKWLGEKGKEAKDMIQAAASVCAPIDLVAAGLSFDRLPQRLLYTEHFLKLLRKKMIQKIYTHRLALDVEVLKKIRTLKAFDDMVTAPLHGFINALDYWHQASSKPYLSAIGIPTLILHAKNDPFIPAHTLPQAHDVSEYVTLLQTNEGGHVGFVNGKWPGQLGWLPNTLITYFKHCLSPQNTQQIEEVEQRESLLI
jgi:predicted alpha/beta-fold hydrolase